MHLLKQLQQADPERKPQTARTHVDTDFASWRWYIRLVGKERITHMHGTENARKYLNLDIRPKPRSVYRLTPSKQLSPLLQL